MSLPSLNKRVEHARTLLSELQANLKTLPSACQEKVARDLEHFADSLEACLQTAAMQAGSEPRLNFASGEAPLEPDGTNAWLEDSLREVHIGAWRWDLATGKFDWSREMYRLHEFDPSLEPMDFDCHVDFFHPDDRIRVVEKLTGCSRSGSIYRDEYRIITRQGRTLWVNTVASIEHDPSGKPVYMSGITQDITFQKAGEEELRESRHNEQAKAAELETILDAVPALVWIARDPACQEMTGSRFGYEFLGMWKGANLSKSAPAPDLSRQRFRNFKNGREIQADELPMQVAAATGEKFEDYEFDIHFDDGRIRSLLGNVIPLMDAKGMPYGAVGAFVDITERKRIEVELMVSEAKERERAAQLQAVIDAVPTPIFLTLDPRGLEITGNRAAYRSMHAEPGTNLSRLATGRSSAPILKELHSGTEILPEHTPLNLALKSGKPVEEYEAHVFFEDGSKVTFLGSAIPLLDEHGRPYGAVGAFMDVTARLAAERSLRLSADRDAYRIALADAMRRLTDPEQIKAIAAQVLGKRLGASRVFYVTVAPGGQEVVLEPGYADGISPLVGRFRLADFSRNLLKDHPDARPYMITDIPNDPKLTDKQRSAYMALNVQAHLDVPLVINGEFAALLSVHQSTPRQWSEDEVALVVETAERTWASVQRAHAETALRESEARFHASIESLLESFVLYSAVRATRTDGKPGKVIDLKIEYVNAGDCRLNGKTPEEMLGHTLLEVLPGPLGGELFKRYLRVIRTGEPLMERALLGDSPESERVYDIHAVKLGDGLVVTRADVTEQVRLETERQQAVTQMEIHRRLTDQSEKDRQSYARELHDGPIQSLASIAYNIQYIKEVFPDPLLRLELEQLGSAVRGAVQELRQVINELRPPSALRFGLTKAIQLHTEDVEEGGSSIHWQFRLEDDENRFPASVSMALFRIYQEAVNNIIRHSDATRAWVHLQVRRDKIVLTIRDNGKGLPPRHDFDSLTLNNHFGLAGMNERAVLVGGKLEIVSKPGGGTRIKAVVPFSGEVGEQSPAPSERD